MISAAVIFHRLGPYHFARLRAAGATVALTAIETSGADETYAWDLVAGADGFQRITLFESADAQKQPTPEVIARMTAALRRLRPQVVVIPGWADAAALAALKWASAHNVPVVTMSESTEWDEVRKSWKEWVKRQVVGLCSASLVGGSPHKDYIVQLGMPQDRVFLGYDAVDNDYFGHMAEESRMQKVESRNKFGLPENYFLASNRFIEKKNLPRLLEAYALYRKKAISSNPGISNDSTSACRAEDPAKADVSNPHVSGFKPQVSVGSQVSSLRSQVSASENGLSSGDQLSNGPVVPWSLVLLGDGELRPALSSRLHALSLNDHVHMPGFIQYPELPHYYAHAGAFIHASTTEQWGLVVNEAMASDLPVLVSNRCGCARDLVQDGVNGFTFDPYNVEQLADLMSRLSSMLPAQRSMLADASRQIIANWGPGRFAQGIKDATDCALRIGPVKPSLLQRLLLQGLLSR